MGVMFGNLSVTDIEERLEITLAEDEKTKLEAMRQMKAENIADDKWHCFDLPFTLLCGTKETAQKVCDILKPYADKMNGQIHIGWERNK